MNLFIFDWTKEQTTPLIEYCKKNARVIGYELEGSDDRTLRKADDLQADAIVINYANKPSFGRMAAQNLHNTKQSTQTPIYFIDGTEYDNEMVGHIGLCLSSEELQDLLAD